MARLFADTIRTIHDGSSVSRLFAEGLRGAAMIDARVQDLLNEVGLKPSPGVQATIAGRDPVLAYRFPVGEAAAVAPAACGVAVSSLWELRGGRPQRARVEVLRAAASLHSRDYLSLNGGPAPLSPASGNPLVDLYRCHVRASLCRSGMWFVRLGATCDPAQASGTGDPAELCVETDTPFGRLRHLKPALELSETPPFWARPTVPLGSHQPAWSGRR